MVVHAFTELKFNRATDKVLREGGICQAKRQLDGFLASYLQPRLIFHAPPLLFRKGLANEPNSPCVRINVASIENQKWALR
jgi:hypothetical protein